ncbi:hypothetical protein WN944_010815 [Citrus x changshan-huyou]|uniref:Large ribosomal subunit protein uL15/eL18 domain-containing protein n=1 Tax=Citrus x changshan-huyou TaxID=2935761 RepID=A0AAP0MUU2_9ROSI
MVPQEVKAKASKDNVPTIDVTQFGYFKVLGKGLLLENQLVVVKAKLVSKTAKKKIKKAVSMLLIISMTQNLGIEESEVYEAIYYDFDNGDYHSFVIVIKEIMIRYSGKQEQEDDLVGLVTWLSLFLEITLVKKQ